MSTRPPTAPMVPTGRPISYNSNYNGESTQQPLTRSFSQRAREQAKLAQEARQDARQDNYLNGGEHIPSQKRMPEDATKGTSKHYSTRPGQPPSANPPPPLEDRQAQAQPDSQGAHVDSRQSTPKASQHHLQSSQPATDVTPLEPDLSSSSGPSNTARGAKPSQARNRDWTSHRSPLQTLEVKLNDISKEEKRARVEEAEISLRESKTGREDPRWTRAAPATAKPSPALHDRPSEPRRDNQAVAVHSLSHRRGLESDRSIYVEPLHSGPRLSSASEKAYDEKKQQPIVESPRPDQKFDALQQPSSRQRMSSWTDDGPDYHAYPEITSADSLRSPAALAPLVRAPAGGSENHGNTSYSRSDDSVRRSEARNQPYPDEAMRATANRRGPLARAIPSNITHAVSSQQSQAQPTFADNPDTGRQGLMRDSNSSHRAALTESSPALGAINVGAPPFTQHDTNRKIQKVRPVSMVRTLDPGHGDPRAMDAGQARAPASEKPFPPRTGADDHDPKQQFCYPGMPDRPDARLSHSRGARPSPGLGVTEPAAGIRDHGIDRTKPASVSFQVPLDKTRPVNEWKQAEVGRLTLGDLALDPPQEHDATWWETRDGSRRRKSRRSTGTARVLDAYSQQESPQAVEFQPPLYLVCGPLLRYTGLRTGRAEAQPGQIRGVIDRETWRGSVLIVTRDSQSSYHEVPTMRLFSQPRDVLPTPPEEVEGGDLAPEYIDPIAGLTKVSRRGKPLYVKPVDHLEEGKDLSCIEDDSGLFETSPSPLDSTSQGSAQLNSRMRGQDGEFLGRYKLVKAARLYAEPERDVTFWRFNIEVELGEHEAHIGYRINRGPPLGFWVPAKGQSMNIMFHSCNGFSLAVNPAHLGGPDPLWRDVLNNHQTRPFHVMIGGGDQIYNDRIMVETQHFGAWTQLKNSQEKRNAPFSDEMREELDTFYLTRYAMWFSQGLFGLANCQIPMVNIYDDHDIIDGFGSYPDDFHKAPVFTGLGDIAFKYYMLFQHQSVPEETHADEPSWLLGAKPGPYIQQLSRSVFMNLGRGIALLGIDCRTERERHSVLTDDTYEIIFERCRREIEEGETRHLLVLVGVPVAYPRLVWLENLLTSRAMIPVKALSRTAVFKGGLLNKFDGGVEVLDDLDDHWTASGHKGERNLLIHDLQELAAEKSVRITILGGDVHLGAIGQFYSNPKLKLKIPKDRDHRYMPNVISSAIVNTPPPEMLADTLNKRNKVHYLDAYTAEDMIPMFTHDVDGKKRNNRRLLPRRNWCSIRDYHPGSTPPSTPSVSPTPSDQMSGPEDRQQPPPPPSSMGRRRFSFTREDADPRKFLRRLSQRGAPPSSYRDEMNISSPIAARRASNDGYFEPQSAPPTRNSFPTDATGLLATPQTAPPSHTSFNQATGSREQGALLESRSSAPNPRPGFFRRPTNLSEKAAKKGGPPPSYDSQGNLISEDLNDHINLEGGLDVSLHCEVSQGDPAGITTPYRLLVPALRYDGTSDREKVDELGVQRKPNLLNKLGVGHSGHRSMAKRQGEGNWGQRMSESGSETFSDGEYGDGEEGHDPDKKRRLSRTEGLKNWLSSRRRERHSSSPTPYQEDYPPPFNHEQAVGQMQGVPMGKDLEDQGVQHNPPSVQPERQTSSQAYTVAAPAPNSSGTRRDFTSNEPVRPRPSETRPFPPQTGGKAARVMGLNPGPLRRDPAMSSSARSPATTPTTPTSPTSPSSSSLSSSSSPRPRQGGGRTTGIGGSSGQVLPPRHRDHHYRAPQTEHTKPPPPAAAAAAAPLSARDSLASPPLHSRFGMSSPTTPVSRRPVSANYYSDGTKANSNNQLDNTTSPGSQKYPSQYHSLNQHQTFPCSAAHTALVDDNNNKNKNRYSSYSDNYGARARASTGIDTSVDDAGRKRSNTAGTGYKSGTFLTTTTTTSKNHHLSNDNNSYSNSNIPTPTTPTQLNRTTRPPPPPLPPPAFPAGNFSNAPTPRRRHSDLVPDAGPGPGATSTSTSTSTTVPFASPSQWGTTTSVSAYPNHPPSPGPAPPASAGAPSGAGSRGGGGGGGWSEEYDDAAGMVVDGGKGGGGKFKAATKGINNRLLKMWF